MWNFREKKPNYFLPLTSGILIIIIVIYQEYTSDSEVQNLRLKRAVKSESLKSAVGKFATRNTLIPTFRTFHQQKNVGLKLPTIIRAAGQAATFKFGSSSTKASGLLCLMKIVAANLHR